MRATLEAQPNAPDPMIPGMGLLLVNKDLRAQELAGIEREARVHKPRRMRRALRSRWLAWTVALVVSVSAAGVAAVGIVDVRRDADRSAAEIAGLRTQATEATDLLAAELARTENLRMRVAKLQGMVAELKASRVRTIVETETVTVTETVIEYVPNGKEISVEITGFEGLVEIYDVQLTHAYGYSDLIGIAENTSGEVISYAQLGCSFLDAEGGLLATGMDNKQDWQPGQSWGFVCSADVDATGGILRVDEMS